MRCGEGGFNSGDRKGVDRVKLISKEEREVREESKKRVTEGWMRGGKGERERESVCAWTKRCVIGSGDP